MREQLTLLQETVLPLAHQVILHLHLGRAAPATTRYQAEHRKETLLHQLHILLAVIGKAHHTLARHIVGVVCFRACLRVAQLTRQVTVVKRDFRERALGSMAVHVRHHLVHKGRVRHVFLVYQYAVLRAVQYVGNGALTQRQRFAVLVGILLGIEQFACLRVPHIQFTAHKHVVHFPYARIPGLVGKLRDGHHQTFHLDTHLTGALVAELAADEARIPLALVLVHLLAETKRTRRQRVPGLHAVALNGL